MTDPTMARPMWHLIEPIHAVLYYAPEVYAAAGSLGYTVDTRWPSYFAWRGAPLGAAGERAVSSAFYSFSPAMVGTYVPAAWCVAEPSAVLTARTGAIDAALRALLGDAVDSPEMAEAAALARQVALAAAGESAGRPLAAANADLPWPDEPHLVLWHATTILREHRGDGHIAALLTAGLDPTESLVSFAAVGAAPVEVFASRGWTAAEWRAARDRLHARGLVDAAGTATAAGRAVREEVERRTDELAAGPWTVLGPQLGRFAQLTAPFTMQIAMSGLLPMQSTLGIRRP
jgi:Helix-turn-helix family